MAIDLGDNPVGTPPTADQSLQIKSVLGLSDAALLQKMTHSELLSLSANTESDPLLIFSTDTESFHLIAPGKTGMQAKTLVAANAEGNLEAGVLLEDFTGQTPDVGALGRVGGEVRIGDGVTLGGRAVASGGLSFIEGPGRELTPADHGRTLVHAFSDADAFSPLNPAITIPDSAEIPVGFFCDLDLSGFEYSKFTLSPLLTIATGVKLDYVKGNLIFRNYTKDVTLDLGHYSFTAPVGNCYFGQVNGAITTADQLSYVIPSLQSNQIYDEGGYVLEVLNGTDKGSLYPVSGYVSGSAFTIDATHTGHPRFSPGDFFAVKKMLKLSEWIDPTLVTSDPATTIMGFLSSLSLSSTGRRTELKMRSFGVPDDGPISSVGLLRSVGNDAYVYNGAWALSGFAGGEVNEERMHPKSLIHVRRGRVSITVPTVFPIPANMHQFSFYQIKGRLSKEEADRWVFYGDLV